MLVVLLLLPLSSAMDDGEFGHGGGVAAVAIRQQQPGAAVDNN
jgi:hypothetical protein